MILSTNKMKNYIYILILIVLTTSCKKEKNRICGIYENEHGYSIGTIEKMTSNPTSATYHYSYELYTIGYNGKLKAYGIGQDNSSAIGKSFLVVYELSAPSNSNLNTDYRIESESELGELTLQFEEEPPKPVWTKCK